MFRSATRWSVPLQFAATLVRITRLAHNMSSTTTGHFATMVCDTTACSLLSQFAMFGVQSRTCLPSKTAFYPLTRLCLQCVVLLNIVMPSSITQSNLSASGYQASRWSRGLVQLLQSATILATVMWFCAWWKFFRRGFDVKGHLSDIVGDLRAVCQSMRFVPTSSVVIITHITPLNISLHCAGNFHDRKKG
eukprot:Gb_07243 [translate_table: standard]